MNCIMPAGELPVLYEADAVVLGGSFAGVACAVKLAQGGRKVVVAEPRTYLGREATATLRSWFELPDGIGEDRLPEPIRFCLERSGPPRTGEPADAGTYRPLHADRLKLGLEDLLAENGVELLYASAPIGLLREAAGAAAGVVIANKSGRQAIRAALVVDASETAIAAGLSGGETPVYRPGAVARYMRTLEFTEADDGAAPADGTLALPAELGIAGDSLRLRAGSRGAGHVWAEFALELPSGNDYAAHRDRELEARRRGMALAAYLIGRVPAFRKALLAASSYELHGPFPPADEASAAQAAALAAAPPPAGDPLAAWQTAVPGVHCLAQPLFRTGSAELHDPVRAAALGERAAAELLRQPAEARSGAASAPSGAAAARDGAERPPAAGTADADAAAVRPGAGGEPGASRAADCELHIPALTCGRDGRSAHAAEQPVPVLREVDVLVVGGGSSGASAAIAAADEGMAALLVDLNPGLGGTGTFGGVDSYWFGRRTGCAANIAERVQAVQQSIGYKGHKWNIEAKMHALLQEAERAGVELALNAITFGAVKRGNRVCGAVVATRWGPRVVLSRVAIDATGDGDIAAYAGAEFVYGSEKDHAVMWYSLAQFRTPGRTQNNFTSMVDVSDALDYTRAIKAGRRRGEDCHDHGIYVATRESRHIRGEVVMRLTDQLLQRKWPDVINVHFSNHDVKGVSGADWVNIGLFPPNLEIEVPYRMLLPQGVDGLLVAGKAISATHDALPAIRMQSDLENLGAAAALAAALAVRAGVEPRAVDLRALQTRLAAEGLIPANAPTRRLAPIRYSEEELERLADSIETAPLYEYANMRMNEVRTDRIPFVEVCSAGPRMIPILERALARADGAKKVRLAQALAMLGSQAGVPALIEAIAAELRGPELPVRTADIMYVQLPPDHGAMPDAAYLLYSLAQAADPRSVPVWERVTELLRLDEASFRDSRKGLFYYVDAVCQGAERLGDRASIPALRKLHAMPLLHGRHSAAGAQADYFKERAAMLELAIGRALARSGGVDGYRILINYLTDNRSLLAKQALLELRRLSGLPLAPQPQLWEDWLREQEPCKATRPLQLRLDFEPDSESLLRVEC